MPEPLPQLWPLRRFKGPLMATCTTRALVPSALRDLFEASVPLGPPPARRAREPVLLLGREALKEELQTSLEPGFQGL